MSDDADGELRTSIDSFVSVMAVGSGTRDAAHSECPPVPSGAFGVEELASEAHVAAQEQETVPEVSRKVAAPRSRTKRVRARARTIALKRLTRAELARGAEMYPPVEDVEEERPRTRDDCRDAPRPCPWVACKHHLYLDINPRTGSIKINFPDLEPWELAHTCALDVADNGGLTLEEIGLITNLTRERVRQVEVRGLLTLRARSNALR